jgi:hypothetical protein
VNIIGGLLGTVPPFSAMQIQRIDGGFICCVPPGPPVAAEDGNCAAGALFLWLAAYTEPEGKSSRASGVDQSTVRFEWPEATCPEGSVFQVSKIRRAAPDGDVLKRPGFFLTHHNTLQNSGRNVVVFSRPAVMERFKGWLAYVLPTEEEMILQRGGGMLQLQGMRINARLEVADEGTFQLHVVASPGGPAPFVARKVDPPGFQLGLSDMAVVHYVAHCLGEDARGIFLSRVHEAFLEFGPLIEDDGEGDEPVFPVHPDPTQQDMA